MIKLNTNSNENKIKIGSSYFDKKQLIAEFGDKTREVLLQYAPENVVDSFLNIKEVVQ